jgi:alpha-tubulin suppressor-like RCC1 family protein
MGTSTRLVTILALGLAACGGGGGTDPDVDAPPGDDGDANPATTVVQLAAGAEHTCARFSSGELRCWGSDREGQIGDDEDIIGPIDPIPSTVVSGLDRDVAAVVAGDEHTCALVTGGGVKCWGNDGFGQLGNDPGPNDAGVPEDVTGLATGVTAIAAGSTHTCAVVAGGAVKCWGRNNSGQLGDDGSSSFEYEPVDVVGVTGAVALAAGAEHTCALVTGGAMKCWGRNGYGQLGNDQVGLGDQRVAVDVIGLGGAAVAITAGGEHTCALLDSGAVRCWGFDMLGQLGNTSIAPWTTLPDDVVGATSGVTAIAAGAGNTCAIAGGALRCWGTDRFGQLGDGAPGVNQGAPVDVVGIAGATAIAVGTDHACVALDTGEVRCWGSNAAGQLGRPWVMETRLVPTPVAGLDTGVTAVFAGSGHNFAVQAGGPRAWGRNYLGELSFGGQLTLNDHNTQSIPVAVTSLPPLASFSVGAGHTCGLTPTGGVMCWGGNLSGQIGNGVMDDREPVTQVLGLDTGIAAIGAGFSHSCALREVGTVACWGSNESRQVGGASTTVNYPSPNGVPGITTAIALAVGAAHSCVVVTGDTVKCWGANDDAQLGDGTTMDRSAAVDVIGLVAVDAVSPGASHTCALVGGGVKCWGSNSSGQLGDGTTTPRPLPVDVLGLTGVAQVSSGALHTCALLTGGEVRCWGNNLFGALGDGTTMERHQPTPVALPGPAQAVAAGFLHTCALLTSGAVMCWGVDEVGQIGDDTTWGYGTTSVPLAATI